MNGRRFFRPDVAGLLGLVVVCVVLSLLFVRTGEADLVVYCAHDELYARAVIEAFERETGLRVVTKFDTEATKSLGLTEQIIAEADAPVCDVFWNNQLLGTADLAQRGLLQPYKGEGYARIDDRYKDPDGLYAGFAARMRVYVLNRRTWPVADDPTATDDELDKAITRALAGSDLSRIAVAQPMYGTTLSHYSLLWHLKGGEAMQTWHRDWREKGVVERGGNATTKDLVAAGTCDIGWTDSSDYFVGLDEGHPLRMAPIYVYASDGSRHTICIPNTVGIIKNAPHLENARRFADFLLSERVELMLAASKSRQVPLGPIDETKIDDDIRQMRHWAEEAYPLMGLLDDRRQCLAWLKSEYVR